MKLIAIIFLIVVQIGISENSELDYRAPSFYSMLENSDLVIRSEIINQTDSTILLKIDKILKGKLPKDTLEIKKFKDWSCSSRHHAYEIGQKQINLLKLSIDNKYRGMSPGNEGELPIHGNYIYCKSWFNRESEFEGNLGRINGFKFELNESEKGLKRMINLIENISSNEKNCELLQIETNTSIGSMIIEERIMRLKLKYECERFEEFKFKVINDKMYWH